VKTKTPSSQPPAGYASPQRRRALWTSVFGRRKATLGIVRYAKEDVLALERLLAAGEYRPVTGRVYRLEDVVGAHRYFETRRKTGNVLLSLNGGPR
jgi:NADPH:quinone reductase-like Zn-dependent oxidoreductase